jgi:hypothetical protein
VWFWDYLRVLTTYIYIVNDVILNPQNLNSTRNRFHISYKKLPVILHYNKCLYESKRAIRSLKYEILKETKAFKFFFLFFQQRSFLT